MTPERPGLYAPGLDVVVGGVAAEIKAFDPDLVVVFNKRIERFEVYDRAAPAGPKWQLVMRIQTPAGGFRHLAMSDLEMLRRSRVGDERQMRQRIRQIEDQEERAERAWEKDASETALEMAEDLKWFGRAVVPSVASRERTDPAKRQRIVVRDDDRAQMREAIRQAAFV